MSKYDQPFPGYKTNLIDLHDDWGMAGRSLEWQFLEQQLRELHCKEYGHSYFPGPPWSWKEFCKCCGQMPPECPHYPHQPCKWHREHR